MKYAEVSNEAELLVLEHLHDKALEMATLINRADTLDAALLVLVKTKIEYIRRNLKTSEDMN